MKNTLQMRIDPSYSLNFLIYIQNIYLNKRNENLKFPYIPTNFEFRGNFEVNFKEIWSKVSMRIFENPINDLHIFTEEKNIFYDGLFTESDVSLQQFNELYMSFRVWWDSFAGHFSVERSIDEKVHKIYIELAEVLLEKRTLPRKPLNISLIYDDCTLFKLEPSAYFAVISIRDCMVNDKELIQRLQLSVR